MEVVRLIEALNLRYWAPKSDHGAPNNGNCSNNQNNWQSLHSSFDHILYKIVCYTKPAVDRVKPYPDLDTQNGEAWVPSPKSEVLKLWEMYIDILDELSKRSNLRKQYFFLFIVKLRPTPRNQSYSIPNNSILNSNWNNANLGQERTVYLLCHNPPTSRQAQGWGGKRGHGKILYPDMITEEGRGMRRLQNW